MKISDKIKGLVKKYVPSILIMFSSAGSLKAAPNMKNIDAQKTNTTLTSQNSKGNFTFNHQKFNVNKMHIEDLVVLYHAGNNFCAKYGGKTMKTVKAFGPLLTDMEDLKAFILAHKADYPDLAKVVEKEGIQTEAFENVWSKYDTPEMRQKITSDLIKHFWNSRIQSFFSANAKIGYPEITYETANDPKNIGYVMSVLTCIKQSLRQTLSIYKAAKEKADAKLGNKATLDDYIDASYDERNNRWGLDLRYNGPDGKSGEKQHNQKIRKTFALELQKMSIEEQGTTTDLQAGLRTFDFSDVVPDNLSLINQTDAIKNNIMDSLMMRNKYEMDNQDMSPRTLIASIKEEQQKYANMILSEDNLYEVLQHMNLETDPLKLQAQQAKESAELEALKAEAYDLSHDTYSVLGKKFDVDYTKTPVIMAPLLWESSWNPMAKDGKKAIGYYQFNVKNTLIDFVNTVATDFPELKNAMDNHGARSEQFGNTWKELSYGPQKDKFNKFQHTFMWNKHFKRVFDKLHADIGAPDISVEDLHATVTETQKPVSYIIAVASLTIQGGPHGKVFKWTKQAYKTLKAQSKDGTVDWNEVGLLAQKIRDDNWGHHGKYRKSIHSRIMGGKGYLGEYHYCERAAECQKNLPELTAQIESKQNRLRVIEYALNTYNKKQMEYMAQNQDQKETIKESKNKYVAIMSHARNMRQLQHVKLRIAKSGKLVKVITDQPQNSDGISLSNNSKQRA